MHKMNKTHTMLKGRFRSIISGLGASKPSTANTLWIIYVTPVVDYDLKLYHFVKVNKKY